MSDTLKTRLGWILSGLFILFMLLASVAPKLAGAAVATDTMTALGWPASATLPIGLVELAGTLLYAYRRTSVFGAVLMMGLLGGATATQFRVGNPLFSHELFGVYLGLLMWGGLWLRDPDLRAIFPLRR